MPNKVHIKDIHVGDHTLRLILNNQIPHVEWNQHIFAHLWFLVAKLPELSHPTHLPLFAEISNFFWKGTDYQCINSIPHYQQFYIHQIEAELDHPADVFPYRLTDYKIFDVSVMHDPKIEGGKLIYFVYQVQTGLPYKVVCPFPYESRSTVVHYQILPLLKEG